MLTIKHLLLVLIFLSTILISLFIFLVLRKIRLNKQKQCMRTYKDEARLAVLTYIQTGQLEALPMKESKLYLSALIQLFFEYEAVLDSKLTRDRLKHFASVYLQTYTREMLRKKQPIKRLNALLIIETFYMDCFIEELEALYANKKLTKLEETLILKLFALFNFELIIERLMNIKFTQSSFDLLTVFSKINIDTFSHLLDHYHSLSTHYKLTIIDAIAVNKWTHFKSFLKELLHDENEEIQIKILKACSELNIDINESDLLYFLQSPVWELRLMAIKLIRARKLESLVDYIINRLEDQEYMIRKEAAKTLVSFKDGKNYLSRVIENSNDKYASDMAHEWLQRGKH